MAVAAGVGGGAAGFAVGGAAQAATVNIQRSEARRNAFEGFITLLE
jgi:hypothetical protein